MPLDPRDLARLRDIEIYADRALRYLEEEGDNLERLQASTLVQDAILRCFEVMGEAARAITAPSKAAHPTIPWPFIIGMRNRVIHEYRRVDLALVYQTVLDDLPGLLAQVRAIIAGEAAAS